MSVEQECIYLVGGCLLLELVLIGEWTYLMGGSL